MRIGIFTTDISPTQGGEYTFQTVILNSLRTYSGSHEFILLTPHANKARDMLLPCVTYPCPHWTEKADTCMPRLLRNIWRKISQVTQLRPSRYSAYNDRILAMHNIDCVWFMQPRYHDTNIPFFITVWDVEYRHMPWYPEYAPRARNNGMWNNLDHFYSTVLPRATGIITGTDVGKKDITHFYSIHPDRIYVNPMPVNISDDAQRDNCLLCETFDALKISRKYILYPAQFWAHKNHAHLVRAIEHLVHSRKRNITVVFCGSDHGNKEYIMKLVNKAKLDKNIIFTGFVTDLQLRSLYFHAHALVYPSLIGPDNIPPLEAWASDCPVAINDSPGAREQLGDAALYFNGIDHLSIANALEKLLDDEGLRALLIQRGRERVKERTGGEYIQKMDKIFTTFEAYLTTWHSGV